ncbi:MAG: bifunctional metallophosphatase/5'-nucleotidase, partial [Planctomycetota bacterium]
VPGAVELDLGHGFALTVVGATTVDTPTTTFPDNVEGLHFAPVIERVQKELARRSAKGPAVVLGHTGWSQDRKLAAAIPELTAIVGGHDQVLFAEPRQVGGVPVVQAFEKAKFLGRLDCRFFPATSRTDVMRASVERIAPELPEDAGVAAIVRTYSARVQQEMSAVIGHTEALLDGGRERVRYQETNLGSWLADVMRETSGAEIALLNAGAVRGSFERGEIELGDAFRVFPYPNGIWLVDLEGRVLLEALTRAVRSSHDEEDGGFLHVSGMRWVAQGTRVASVDIAGAPLDPKRSYRVAISDFVRAGGDGYAMLKDPPGVDTGHQLRDAVIEALKRGPVAPPAPGRFLRR